MLQMFVIQMYVLYILLGSQIFIVILFCKVLSTKYTTHSYVSFRGRYIVLPRCVVLPSRNRLTFCHKAGVTETPKDVKFLYNM